MIERDQALTVLEAALAQSKADDLELALRATSEATTRFANSAITQNVETRHDRLSVTAYFGKRKGSASTNSLENAAVRGCVERAEEIAKISPEDPEALPSLGAQSYREGVPGVEATASFGPEERAAAAREMVEIARAGGATLAGTVQRYGSALALAGKNGLRAFYKTTAASTSCTADAGEDGSGWAEGAHRDVRRVDFAAIAQQATATAIAARNPREVEAGDWTVLLEPIALAGLINYMIWFWGARDTYAGRTFLSNKVGERLVGENINLESRPFDPDLFGAPFDWDGIPAYAGPWIDAGRIVRFFHDRWTAKEQGIAPTGWPMGLCLRGGTESPATLVGSVERGILVKRLWYIRAVDPMKVLLTGMTRDGTFLVEEGKIVGAVRNLRFNDSTLRVLSQIDALSAAQPTQGRDSRMRMPMVRVRDFHFDSATKF